MRSNPIKILHIIIILCAFYFPATGFAQQIFVTGSWSLMIDDTDLQSGAGSDLNSTYESLPDQLNIDLKIGKKKPYRVDVSKIDNFWHGDMILSVHRTTDGNSGNPIFGGTGYQTIDAIDQTFFTGTGKNDAIQAQYRLDGVSTQIPANIYTTTVYFTMTEQ